MARKHNYLNNKDLLHEIHKSKNTYCLYRNPTTDHDFDMILNSIDEITQSSESVRGKDETGRDIIDMIPNIQLAKEFKAKRLSKFAYDQAVKEGQKVKQAEFAIDPESYSNEDIVFRINEFGHVPWAPPKVLKTKPKRKKIVQSPLLVDSDDDGSVVVKKKYVKCNFPPFYHYRYEGNKLIQIGKSHWKGEYKNGEFIGKFSTKHGNMTEKLALMFMKLCERYATKGNWRGYCVDSETEALTQRGWLTESEINEDDIILSYNNGNMVWSEIKSIFRDEYDGLMHKLDSENMDSLITPGHKLVTKRGLVKFLDLKSDDTIIILSTFNKDYSFQNITEPMSAYILTNVFYKGTVWCPETEYGCFVARRNGKVYLTGNTYNDEMRGQAMLQLSTVGLQFNECKSQNPFAYYTAIVNNAFTRVLNIEKRNQVIRDDILESNDLTPSYTRQNENEMAMKAENKSAAHGSVINIDADSGSRRILSIAEIEEIKLKAPGSGRPGSKKTVKK